MISPVVNIPVIMGGMSMPRREAYQSTSSVNWFFI